MDDLAYLSAGELLAGYADGSLSPVEATRAALDRIDAHDGILNAFILVDHEGALAAAGESEKRWRAGTPCGPLDGVPTSIKDLMLTRGWPTLRGSRTVDADGPWDEDAPCVARLREAGAVLLGKTTTPEFGWKGLGDSPLTGITRNPWNPDKTPGGSSAGAASALAAGMGALAIGSDGGGSIRIPAGFTGVFGIKANFGRVPAWPPSPMGTLSHVGPMSRTVADSARMLSVIAGADVRDWTALPPESRDWSADLDAGIAGLRVAYSPDLGYARVDADVAARVREAVDVLAGLGAEISETDPGFEDPRELFMVHWWGGATAAFGGLPADKLALLEPELAGVVEEGRRYSAGDYVTAAMARAELGKRMRLFHETYDLLVTPALAVPAFDVGRLAPDGYESDDYWLKWTPFSYPFNLTQQPACSIFCGLTGDGLPVGLQIVAANFREDLVLRAAQAYESARGPIDWPTL